MILQSESAECGLAAVAMIASYYGRNVSLTAMRHRFDVALSGMSLTSIISTARELGFDSRPVKAPLKGLLDLQKPAVLHWNMDHFVVLAATSRRGVTIHDPARGRIVVPWSEANERFTGIALEITPGRDFMLSAPEKGLRIRDLWSSVTGLKRGALQLLLLSGLLQATLLISPLFLQIVVDDVILDADSELLIAVAIGFAGVAMLTAATSYLRDYVVILIGSSMSYQIASNLFRRLLHLPADFYQRRHMGDVVSRFKSLDPIKNVLTQDAVGALIDGVMALTTAIVMCVYSVELAFISFAAWGLLLTIRIVTFKRVRSMQETSIRHAATENSHFMESIDRITTVKLFGGEASRLASWQNRYADAIRSGAQLERVNTGLGAITGLISGAERVIVVAFGASMALSGQITVGMIFAFLAHRETFSGKASNLVEQVIVFKMLSLHLSRLEDFVLHEVEGNVQGTAQLLTPSLGRVDGRLELRDVVFGYGTEGPSILNGIDLLVESGESVAITGVTGCGKTTLLKIMTTLVTPRSGDMLIDGKVLRPAQHRAFRDQIGVVMQDESLLSGSIADNIAPFEATRDDARLREAAAQACLLEEIEAMPMGFDSLIGDKGSALSGGQRQRLTIARALYRRPRVLFLDEGTSQLDVATEQRLNGVIRNLGITRVMVAHRPETIRSADRVLRFEDGRLTPSAAADDSAPARTVRPDPSPFDGPFSDVPSEPARNPADEQHGVRANERRVFS